MIDSTLQREIEFIASVLRAGDVAIIPTDTVYGVAASLNHPEAIEKLYVIKDRPSNKPIPILVDSVESAATLSYDFSYTARRLVSAFWPGALTIVVRASTIVPDRCRGPGGTVGLRMPAHPVTLEILRKCGGTLAVTSANRSGEPETRCAGIARAALSVEAVLDSGKTPGGVASTVVDTTGDPPKLLRPGAIVEARIIETLAR